MLGQQASHDAGEVDDDVPFALVGRAEIDGRRHVQQQPGRDFALFDVLAHVRRVHARRDVPVHVARVVFCLVLAHLGKVVALTREHGAVVALQDAVELAHDRPVDALEQRLGVSGSPVEPVGSGS